MYSIASFSALQLSICFSNTKYYYSLAPQSVKNKRSSLASILEPPFPCIISDYFDRGVGQTSRNLAEQTERAGRIAECIVRDAQCAKDATEAIPRRSIYPCCRPGIYREDSGTGGTAGRSSPECSAPSYPYRGRGRRGGMVTRTRSSPGRSVIRRGPRARRTCESRRNSRGPWPRPLKNFGRESVQCRGRGDARAAAFSLRDTSIAECVLVCSYGCRSCVSKQARARPTPADGRLRTDGDWD